MAGGTQVKIDGMRLVRRNLRAVSSDLPKGLNEIHRKVAEPVAENARRRVRSRSGRLAGTITARGTQTAARITAGSRLAYGAINHWGGYPGDYAGNPFLQDAMADLERPTIEAYDTLLTDWLEGIWQDNF